MCKTDRLELACQTVVFLALLASLFGMSFIWSRDNTSEAVQQENRLDGPYAVIRVIDGDTISVEKSGDEKTIRLIGIDAPESVHPDPQKNTPAGEASSAWMKELLDNKSVYLEYDVETEDQYGRTLAYLYLDDQKTMVNMLLVEEGYADVMTVYPNIKHEKDLKEAQGDLHEENN